MRFSVLLLLAGLAVGLPGMARSQQAGDVVVGSLQVDGKQIPLPHGEWIVAGAGLQDFDLAPIGAFGGIRSVVLLQRDGRRVVAIAEVNTNAIAVNDGWGRSRACARGDQFLLLTRYRTGWDNACLFVQPTRIGEGGPATWQAARRFAATAGLSLPDVALTAGFRISDRQDLVDLRFHFDPAIFAGATAGMDWSPAVVRADPARLEAVQLLSAWAIGFDGRIAAGLRNGPPGPPAAMPQNAAFISETPQVDGKLAALEQLLSAGAITRTEYLRQARLAVREQPVLVEQSSGLPVAVQKNISFRVFGSTVDYALAFIVTLDSPLSAYITASIVAIHSVIFVLNDNYWEDYWARRSTRDANRLVDFTYIGEPA